MSEPAQQHLISRVLLARWATDGQLSAFNLDLGTVWDKSPKAEGFITNFIAHRASEAEARWKQIEDHMPTVFDHIDRRASLDDVDAQQRLTDFVALHFARSRTVLRVYQLAWSQGLDDTLRDRDLMTLANLDEYFRAVTGLEPAGPGARMYALERIGDDLAKRFGTDSPMFGHRVMANFDRIKAEFTDGMGFDIGIAEDGEFLIGDHPVVTYNDETGQFGVLGGVALGDADTFWLPLGPHYAIAARTGDRRYVDVPHHAIERMNAQQVVSAEQKVYFRPGSGLDEFVRKIKPR